MRKRRLKKKDDEEERIRLVRECRLLLSLLASVQTVQLNKLISGEWRTISWDSWGFCRNCYFLCADLTLVHRRTATGMINPNMGKWPCLLQFFKMPGNCSKNKTNNNEHISPQFSVCNSRGRRCGGYDPICLILAVNCALRTFESDSFQLDYCLLSLWPWIPCLISKQ